MKKKTKGLWIAWLLVLPVVIVRAFTTLYPIIMTFINSTYDMSLLKGNNFQFIGLGNYLRIFEDQKLLSSIGFTVKFTVVSMFFHLVLGVILALMLNMKIKGKKFLRTIVLIPWAMPMVVAGLAARWAFNDQYGLINDLIRRFVPNFHYDWLVHANSAQGAVQGVPPPPRRVHRQPRSREGGESQGQAGDHRGAEGAGQFGRDAQPYVQQVPRVAAALEGYRHRAAAACQGFVGDLQPARREFLQLHQDQQGAARPRSEEELRTEGSPLRAGRGAGAGAFRRRGVPQAAKTP